jgi:SAM-dependent methyltransferase
MGNILIDDAKFVKEQYKNSSGLSTRISIHDKYSTNKMGLHNWYFTVMKFEDGMKVLELGTGSAVMWVNHKDIIGRLSQLVLSDMSEGMLAEAKKNLEELTGVEFEVIDIQDIPYEDNTFDVVIANCMLYHVPDIDKAVSEVRRVLKPGGYFYAGTSGKNGILETIVDILGQDISYDNNFSLENGGEKLKLCFSNVEIERYKDSLEVTNIDDLMDYIYSGITFENSCTLSKDEVRERLTAHMVGGVLKLPKDPGLFVAW